MCGSCYQMWWKEQNPEKYAGRKRRPAPCHPDRPVLARNLCETCYRAWWRSDPENKINERVRDSPAQRNRYQSRTMDERRVNMLKLYGLTVGDYAEMLAKQGGKCAACKQESHRRLQVDHCHETNRVRALLCANCNCALGYAKEDISRLESLVAYLRLHQSTP